MAKVPRFNEGHVSALDASEFKRPGEANKKATRKYTEVYLLFPSPSIILSRDDSLYAVRNIQRRKTCYVVIVTTFYPDFPPYKPKKKIQITVPSIATLSFVVPMRQI